MPESVSTLAEQPGVLKGGLQESQGSSAALSGGAVSAVVPTAPTRYERSASTLPHQNVRKTRDLGPGGYRTPSATAGSRPALQGYAA